ncbi:hypothetical protein G6F68_008129 [Rhizopus microsporus]|nr:hypothetical protein G6F68_008129 [Rhizopus microsporus]
MGLVIGLRKERCQRLNLYVSIFLKKARQKKYDSVTNNYVDASNTGWACQLQLSTGQTQTAHGYWNHQEATMSISWRELEAAFHALQTFPHLKNMRILIRTDNITSMSYMSKQGGTQSLPLMEFQQSDCGLRVSSTIPQKQLNDPLDCVPATPTVVRQKRHRSHRRPSHDPTVKIRVLATRPEQRVDRRIHHPLEQLSEPLDLPSMEPNQPLFAEADHGASSSSNIHHSLVAERSLIPHSSIT